MSFGIKNVKINLRRPKFAQSGNDRFLPVITFNLVFIAFSVFLHASTFIQRIIIFILVLDF